MVAIFGISPHAFGGTEESQKLIITEKKAKAAGEMPEQEWEAWEEKEKEAIKRIENIPCGGIFSMDDV